MSVFRLLRSWGLGVKHEKNMDFLEKNCLYDTFLEVVSSSGLARPTTTGVAAQEWPNGECAMASLITVRFLSGWGWFAMNCFRRAATIAMWGSHIFSGWGLFCFHQALNSWSMTSKVCPDIGKAGSAPVVRR